MESLVSNEKFYFISNDKIKKQSKKRKIKNKKEQGVTGDELFRMTNNIGSRGTTGIQGVTGIQGYY